MQPTTPFNARSWTIRGSEIAGWIALAILYYWQRWDGLSTTAQLALAIIWAGYAFMRLCSLIRWHKNAHPGEGLEQNFSQLSVAAIYGFAVANVAAITHILVFLVYPIALILAAISGINATLLYIFSKDTSTVPINYYSHRKYLEEDA